MKNRNNTQDYREKYYKITYRTRSDQIKFCSILAHKPEEAKKTFRYGHKNVKIISIEVEK